MAPFTPLTSISLDDTQPDQKLPTLHDFFHPGGILANSSLAFEHRAGQYLMAKEIEQSFADHRHLIVEAGTGTGKTLAYLLPALRRAREHKQRIIISTGTKNLQEQLFFKDIPFLETLLGPLRVCYMKGRANYICKQKLYALRDNPLLTGLEEISQFHSILNWERTTETGDRAEVEDLPEHSSLWHKLDARSEVCLGQTCPNWENCFITQMRRKALESDIVIVNHHLFFADLSIKQQAPASRDQAAPDAGILPRGRRRHLRRSPRARRHRQPVLRHRSLQRPLRRTRPRHRIPPPREGRQHLRHRERHPNHPRALQALLRLTPRRPFATSAVSNSLDRADFLEARGDAYLGALNSLQRLEGELERLREVDEAAGLRKRAADIRNHLKFLLESTDPNTVFWIERRATSGLRNAARAGTASTPFAFSTHLLATPIDVSTLLADTLFTHYPSVILTSATLAVASSDGTPAFDHLKRRLGIPFPKELVVPSHFDYAKQALLYLPPGMPPPRDPNFLPQAAEKIRRVLEITRGRAFCLFTSHAQMRELHDRLLTQLPYPLLMQGSAPRHILLQQFRDTPNAVLFGTSSFWQGIDVQGEQLSCVIIDKLPFAVPSDPIMKARTDAITAAGGNAFNDLQVPQAVIALKQGFGRLIRSLSDRGVLMLLDPRIRTTRYGATFLDSLPPYARTDDITEVERFFDLSSAPGSTQ